MGRPPKDHPDSLVRELEALRNLHWDRPEDFLGTVDGLLAQPYVKRLNRAATLAGGVKALKQALNAVATEIERRERRNPPRLQRSDALATRALCRLKPRYEGKSVEELHQVIATEWLKERPSRGEPPQISPDGFRKHLQTGFYERLAEQVRTHFAKKGAVKEPATERAAIEEASEDPSARESELDAQAEAIAERGMHAAKLDEGWRLLEECRCNGEERRAKLELLNGLAAEVAEQTLLDEAKALLEFAAYEGNRGLEKYRLEQGVRLLQSAIRLYGRDSQQHALRLLLMQELTHLAVYGGFVPGDRRETLEEVVELGEKSLEADDIEGLLREQVRVSMAEALKELCFVTHDIAKQRDLFLRARSKCVAVEEALVEDERDAAVRILARAKRHAAITYELQEDKERQTEAREHCIRTWSRLCKEAAELAERVGDDYIRAYSLLNLGSTRSRETHFVWNEVQERKLLEEGKEYLDQSLPLVEALEDDRGRAWVHIHICENIGRRADFEAPGSSERQVLLRDLEHSATQALAHLRLVDDPLGQALAHVHLGKALCLVHEESEADAATMIRLDRATDLLSRAVDMTQSIGYYQEYPGAAKWLARCLEHSWSQDGPPAPEALVKGIDAVVTGLCESYAGQNASDRLEHLFEDLKERLDGELKKVRA
jgi:hypothetical protein